MLYVTFYDGSAELDRRSETNHQRRLARRLLLYALRQEYGPARSLPEMAKGPHGKPYFTDHPAQFSLSHTKGAVCCVLSDREIGIDIERVRPFDERLTRRVCTEEELAALFAAEHPDERLCALWCLKESLMKYTGLGMQYGFQNAVFSFDEQGKPTAKSEKLNTALYRPAESVFMAVSTPLDPPGQFITVNPAYLPELPHIY